MIGIDVLVSTRSEGVVNIKRKRKREGEERKKGGGKEGKDLIIVFLKHSTYNE